MEMRQLGSSKLQVSALSLGSWMTYEFMDERDALAVIRTGIENGINFLDDARYNDRTGHAPIKTGYSEVLFGRLLREGGWNRHDLIIANKLWHEFYPAQSPAQELESSLSRLQMDYLDLVYCELPPPELSIPELVKQVDGLIRSGKLRAWGVLNWSTAQIAEAHRIATTRGMTPPCAAQLAYSVLNRFPVEEESSQQIFRSAGIGIVASYSLYGGLLSGKYNSAEAMKGRFKPEEIETMQANGMLEQVKKFVRIAQELNCTPSQLALAYCLKNELVASVLFGATRISQLQENLAALDVLTHLTPTVLSEMQKPA